MLNISRHLTALGSPTSAVSAGLYAVAGTSAGREGAAAGGHRLSGALLCAMASQISARQAAALRDLLLLLTLVEGGAMERVRLPFLSLPRASTPCLPGLFSLLLSGLPLLSRLLCAWKDVSVPFSFISPRPLSSHQGLEAAEVALQGEGGMISACLASTLSSTPAELRPPSTTSTDPSAALRDLNLGVRQPRSLPSPSMTDPSVGELMLGELGGGLVLSDVARDSAHGEAVELIALSKHLQHGMRPRESER